MSLDEYRFSTDAPGNFATQLFLLSDSPAEGTMNGPGDSDWYRLATDIGSLYGVILLEGSPFASFAADGVFFTLRNRSGAVLATSSSFNLIPDQNLSFFATDTLFYIEVVGASFGDYSLIAANVTAADDFILPIVAEAGRTYTARIDYTGDQETYLLDLTLGVRHFAALWSADIADAVLDIEEPFGAAAAGVVGGAGTARVFTPDGTGEYLFSAYSSSLRDTGSFSFLTGQTLTLLPMWVGTPGADAYGANAAAEFWGWDGDDTATGSGAADALLGGAGNDDLNGGGGNDTLVGGDGADTLVGSAGADSLAGGSGDDFYILEGADVVSEAGGGGIDTVLASQSVTLAAGIEVLQQLSGPPNMTGTGNALANTMIGQIFNSRLNGAGGNDTLLGNAGRDTLSGDGGADSLVGGNGDDLYIVDALDRLLEAATAEGGADTVQTAGSHTLGVGFETLVLTGALNTVGNGNSVGNTITGNTGNNVLNGGGGNDTLLGGEGGDTLTGSFGADSLVGGAGNDLYVADSLDRIVEAPGGGLDTVNSAGNHVLAIEVETLVLTGTANAAGTGTALSNLIIGNVGRNLLNGGAGEDGLSGLLGDDTLIGGAGADVLFGGAGDDLFVADALDTILEVAGEGIDTAQTAGNLILAAEVENLVQTGVLNVAGTGNALGNRMTGNGGNNILSGGFGNDTLIGGNGNDTLIGGGNADSLEGGAGADMFRFDLPTQGIDQIADFLSADDQVLVRAVGFGGGLVAGMDLAANGRFAANDAGAATSAAGVGQFVLDTSDGRLLWDADGAGGAAARHLATFADPAAGGLTAADITVIA